MRHTHKEILIIKGKKLYLTVIDKREHSITILKRLFHCPLGSRVAGEKSEVTLTPDAMCVILVLPLEIVGSSLSLLCSEVPW